MRGQKGTRNTCPQTSNTHTTTFPISLPKGRSVTSSEIPDPSSLHVLAIHAHPDDIEFQCAGTLRHLKRLGCRISVATMTPGDCGSAEHSAEEIARIRRGEAAAAAKILEADYTCLEFRDLSIVFDNDSRRRVTEFIRRTRPDLILTAPPD